MTADFLTTLFSMTLAASIAAVAVLLLRRFLHKAPRRIVCLLWAVVFLRMVCPVSFQAPVSVTNAIVRETATVLQEARPVDPGLVNHGGPVVTVPETEGGSPADTAVSPAPAGPDGYDILFGFWAVGAAVMLGWAVVSYGRLKRTVAEAVPLEGNLYETDRVASPFVCGFFKPRIYLPADLRQEDRDYVVRHERAHVRRLDHLTKPLGWLALSVHWFNPVLWAAYRAWCRDVETACDQAVVRDFGPEDTANYAAALLHLGHKGAIPQAVPLAFGEEDAKGRVKHILDYRRPAVWVVVLAVVAVVIAGVCLLADPDEGQHLEGVPITYGESVANMQDGHWTTLPLPDDLREDLLVLLNQYGHEPYTEAHGLPSLASAISFWSDNGKFYFDTETLALTKDEKLHASVTLPLKTAKMEEELAEDPAYQDWLARYEEFQQYGMADAIYAARVASLHDQDAVTNLIELSGIGNAAGEYDINIFIENSSVQIKLEHFPAFEEDQLALLNYLYREGELLISLIEDAEYIFFLHEYPNSKHISTTVRASKEHLLPTQEEFRALFEQAHSEPTPEQYTTYYVPTVEYIAVEPQLPDVEVVEAFYTPGLDWFSVGVRDAASLSPYLMTEYENVWYNTLDYPRPERFEVVTDPEGNVLLDPNGYEEVEVIQVMDRDGSFTGHTLYRLDGETWASSYNSYDLDRLECLVRLEKMTY